MVGISGPPLSSIPWMTKRETGCQELELFLLLFCVVLYVVHKAKFCMAEPSKSNSPSVFETRKSRTVQDVVVAACGEG